MSEYSGDAGQQQQQAFEPSWKDQIPAELRESPALKDVKDIGSLAKQFIDQQRYLGNSIRIPGEDAGESGRAEFISKLQKHAPELIVRPDANDQEFWKMAGVPGDPSEYTIDEGVEANEQWLNDVKQQAKKYGLTKNGFKQFVADQVADQKARSESTKQAQQADMQSLSQEWGNATEARLNDVKKFAEVMNFPKGFQEALANNMVSSEWIKAINGVIGQLGGMGENKQVAFQRGGSIPDGPAELRAKIAEIESNPAYRNQRDPMNKALVEKRLKYFEQLNSN